MQQEEEKADQAIKVGKGLREDFWDDFIRICNSGEKLAALLAVRPEQIRSWGSRIREALGREKNAGQDPKKVRIMATGKLKEGHMRTLSEWRLLQEMEEDPAPGAAAPVQVTDTGDEEQQSILPGNLQKYLNNFMTVLGRQSFTKDKRAEVLEAVAKALQYPNLNQAVRDIIKWKQDQAAAARSTNQSPTTLSPTTPQPQTPAASPPLQQAQ